jgi:hypothetical protein
MVINGASLGGEREITLDTNGMNITPLKTIITPEGQRIIIAGGQLSNPNDPRRTERSESKEMLLKALLEELSKNGAKADIIPLGTGSKYVPPPAFDKRLSLSYRGEA